MSKVMTTFVLAVVAVLVVGLGLVSSAQAQSYSEDFDGNGIPTGQDWGEDNALDSLDSWEMGSPNAFVGTGAGIGGTKGVYRNPAAANYATYGRVSVPAGADLVQYRALVNIGGDSNNRMQMNLDDGVAGCCAGGNQRVEVGIKPDGFAFYAGNPEFAVGDFPQNTSDGWFEVMLEYNKGTGPGNPGTMEFSRRDVDDTTGLPTGSGAYTSVGFFNVGTNKLGDLDWDAARIGFTLRGDRGGSGGALGTGPRVDNLSVTIPEPTTLVLFSMGVALLMCLRRHRTRR